LAVKINGNHGAQKKIYFNKSFKKTVLFQQEYPI